MTHRKRQCLTFTKLSSNGNNDLIISESPRTHANKICEMVYWINGEVHLGPSVS